MLVVKNLPFKWRRQTRDLGSIPESGRSPRVGNDNPLQYCLENYMDRKTWQVIVHGIAKSRTWPNDWTNIFLGSQYLYLRVKVSQSCLTLCDPMDCSLPGSSVCGILQARILEWAAVPFSRGSSQPRDRTQVSHIADGFFTIWTIRETHLYLSFHQTYT